MTRPILDRHDLENLFARKLLSRDQFIRALAALGMSESAMTLLVGSRTPPLSETSRPRYLVLIVLDAFRADYRKLSPMPALASLASTGTSYNRAWVGQVESETPTGHATLSTGASPKHHGVIGFEWRDPRTKEEALDAWPRGTWSGQLDRDLHRARINSIPHAFKAAHPKSTVIALSSEKVYAADAMGASVADYVICYKRTGPNSEVLAPAGVPGHLPPASFLAHPELRLRLPARHFGAWDNQAATLAVAAVEIFRPEVLLVNLPGSDVYGHTYGGPATPEVMRQVVAGADHAIDRIVRAYRAAGIFDETLFVITADHGMIPNDRTVGSDTIKTAVRRAGGHYYFHTGYTAAYVYLHDPRHARAVAAELTRLPGGTGAFYRSGMREYLQVRGDHLNPSLAEAYQYLLGTFAGARAPDVVAPFRENTISMRFSHAHGDHGGMSWGAQHVPLILAGPGVRSGVSTFPARLMDVAPTILRLFGLPVSGMDGRVLADALLSPAASDVAAQLSLTSSLTRHQEAIIEQSVRDIARDRKAGKKPPPPLPPRP